MFKCIAFCLLVVTAAEGHYPALPAARDDQEAMLVRRVLGFWRDKEFRFAKTQIERYLKENPDSPFTDHFWAMLGDMAQQEHDFEEALQYYSKIQGDELKNHVQLKKWEALYHMGHYAELYQETAPQMVGLPESGHEEFRFYFAEGAFREALTLTRFEEGKEEALALCREALPVYASLRSSPAFGSHAKLAMAEIHRLLGEPEKAASLYLELAEHEENDDILFHAATVLIGCDKPKAMQLFKKIARSGQSRSEDAAYQWLLLLAEGEEWETISHERDLFAARLGKEREPIGFFYLGMISFEKGLFLQASVDLQKCLGRALPAQHEKRALLTLLACGSALEKWELCEIFFDTLTTQYPETKPEAVLMLASAYHKGGNKTRAFKLYESVTQEFPATTWAEKASIEKVRLMIDGKKYKEAHGLILSCLDQYPQSDRKTEMVRLAIQLSLTQLTEEEVYGQLAADLERGLNAKLFYKEEKKEKELLLAKTYLKLDRINSALRLLQDQEDPDPLLLTHCYLKEGTCPEKVVAYGEQALVRYPSELALRLHLFNAYLDMSKDCHEGLFTRKAAEHLSAVIDSFPVSLENRLWLIHYYTKEEPQQAVPLLEALLQTEANLQRFDGEANLLASLYLEQNRLDKAEPLLEKIIGFQLKGTHEAKLKLAEIYLIQGKTAAARTLYEKLEESAQLGIAFAARLRLARLDYADSPEKCLKKLHDLSLRKSLAHEPVHLEAALDYADLKASAYPSTERSQRLLELLTQVKEDFTQQNDICSKDYHASREFFPDKDVVYQAYMRYLDARIYALQAALAHDASESKTKLNAARALFSSLRQGKYAVSTYIKEKATAGLYGQ